MIVFDLQCPAGHVFEGWFDDSPDFERQRQCGVLMCPVCEATDISKLPSAFAIKTSAPPAPQAPPSVEALAAVGEKIREYVDTNFDNVGADFATEALKIRYGVSEQRNIRGYSTEKEEKMLKEEGVPFFKIPLVQSRGSD
jgi:hypothetical protein